MIELLLGLIGPTISTCVGILLAKIIIELYPKLRDTKLSDLLPKRKPSEEIMKEMEFRKAIEQILHAKPGPVKEYIQNAPGSRNKVINYFEGKLKSILHTEDPLLHKLLVDELDRRV